MLAGMADIVLVQPPFEDFYATGVRTLPLGLMYVAAALARDGFSAALIDALQDARRRQAPLPREFAAMREHTPPDRSPFALFHGYHRYGLEDEEILERIGRERPRMIGVSLLTTAYSGPALRLARRARERFPGAVLFCGGHHPTRFPEACLEVFDYAVRGDGEEASVRLAHALLRGRGDPGDIEGVCQAGGAAGPRIRAPSFLAAEALDGLQPARTLAAPPVVRGRRFTQILTSRGCPLRCSYCSTARHLTGGHRKRRPASVLDEFAWCRREHGISHFNMEDENLTLDRDRTRALLQGLIRLFPGRPVLLTAMNGLLPETLDAGTVRLMREAGFDRLDLSLGSTRPQVLRRYGRPEGLLGPFLEAVDAAHRLGMGVTAYVISGGPHAAARDVLEDLLRLAALPVRVGLSTYYPAPGSLDYEGGLFPKPASFSLHRASVYPVEAGMNRVQMVTASRLARVVNYLKGLPDRGVRSMRGVAPAREGEVVPPEEAPRLAASFLARGDLMGLAPGSRRAYTHRADPALADACREGLIRDGRVVGFRGALEL